MRWILFVVLICFSSSVTAKDNRPLTDLPVGTLLKVAKAIPIAAHAPEVIFRDTIWPSRRHVYEPGTVYCTLIFRDQDDELRLISVGRVLKIQDIEDSHFRGKYSGTSIYVEELLKDGTLVEGPIKLVACTAEKKVKRVVGQVEELGIWGNLYSYEYQISKTLVHHIKDSIRSFLTIEEPKATSGAH